MNVDMDKLQIDLRNKLDRLSLIFFDPSCHVSEHFAALRGQVDSDAESIISATKSTTQKEQEISEAVTMINTKRIEFIRILDDLEEKTIVRLLIESNRRENDPITVDETFEQRVKQFNDSLCSNTEDDLEESYIQLALEIMEETEKLEKRIFGEQTIIYWPSLKHNMLGRLVYFSDIFLSKTEIDWLIICKLSIVQRENRPTLTRIEFQKLYENFSFKDLRRKFQNNSPELLVPFRQTLKLNKSFLAVLNLCEFFSSNAAKEPKFFYIGKANTDYAGYSVDGLNVETKFVSYQYERIDFELNIAADMNWDTLTNLFDLTCSRRCKLEMANHRLKNLNACMLPSPVNRLSILDFRDVHLEDFDPRVLADCVNLTHLSLNVTYSRRVKFDFQFLTGFAKLSVLKLTLPDAPFDFSPFKQLCSLTSLKLSSSSAHSAQPFPSLSKRSFKHITSSPLLRSLYLSYFGIKATIDQTMSERCPRLSLLNLRRNRIDRIDVHALSVFETVFLDHSEIREWKCDALSGGPNRKRYLSLRDTRIRSLNDNNYSLRGHVLLEELCLGNNSITELSRGVFDDLTSLILLDLSDNRIREVKSEAFGPKMQLRMLKLDGNPIESIEPNAFSTLESLKKLYLYSCRLESIDSEMFNGLKNLISLELDNNLIERIEVVAEDGRRIDVIKTDLSEQEKQLVKRHLFKDFSRLQELQLKENKLARLDLNVFANLKELSELDLSTNRLNGLSGEVGPDLLRHLRFLHLKNNQLSSIDSSALPRSISVLDLSANKLKHLADDFFNQFTMMMNVNLCENEQLSLTAFKEAMFTFFEGYYFKFDSSECARFERETVDHSENQGKTRLMKGIIRGLSPSVVSFLQMIHKRFQPEDETSYLNSGTIRVGKIRSLRRDPITESDTAASPPYIDSFNLNWLQDLTFLSELDLSGNIIETLDDASLFKGCNFLRKISFSKNRLSRINRKCIPLLDAIDLSKNCLCSVDLGLFRNVKQLRQLNLCSNSISFLNLARLFRICPRLQSLNLAENQLDDRSTIEQIDYMSVLNLRALVLTNNRLETIGFIRDMTSLLHLDLSGNRIVSVMSNKENMLARLIKLSHLDLSENRIDHLTDEMFAHLRGQLEYLEIAGNPLDTLKINSVHR